MYKTVTGNLDNFWDQECDYHPASMLRCIICFLWSSCIRFKIMQSILHTILKTATISVFIEYCLVINETKPSSIIQLKVQWMKIIITGLWVGFSELKRIANCTYRLCLSRANVAIFTVNNTTFLWLLGSYDPNRLIPLLPSVESFLWKTTSHKDHL